MKHFQDSKTGKLQLSQIEDWWFFASNEVVLSLVPVGNRQLYVGNLVHITLYVCTLTDNEATA